ncbi:Phage terminase-like protein, large subunit, contains N-terminal HTH domain [Yoonia tamlensis]|uniref:Phage terminase-like protein, large subunit, contains N-terminal HTH domain n=1 Tax=Yoonia tamlensis TaxID=390270 RepID=A0A1I6GEG4_9RHOB|nr:terminase large subunit [Yoonia tamlensis]SFR40548.1 Phage terminase-like protein, large subunit, contains N-terminal HTH domain [Yoonia tamlensis]
MAAPVRTSDWSTAVPDWEQRIVRGESLVPTLPLFDAVAEKALVIFKRMRIPDLEGCPTFGEVCEDWVFDLVRTIFGSYDPVLKKRMLREFFLLVPKKNGKSAIAAGIIMTATIMNTRPQAELFLIAPTQKIASISFKTCKGIIALDPVLRDTFHVQPHLKMITLINTEATIAIVSADGDLVTGSKASFILIDELHVLGAKPKADEIMTELRGGLASRPEGFLLTITTQSKKEPQGQFKRELMRARAVRDGTEQLPVLAVLYELPPQMTKNEAWRNEETWGLINPNLDVSVSLDYLRDEFKKAVADGADAMALFASQHLNVEIGIGLHSQRWLAADYWAGCTDEALDLAAILDRCEVAVLGGDMGGADDLASLNVLGREKVTGRRLTWAKAWCSPDVLDRRKEIAPKLLDLAETGDLIIEADTGAHVDGMVALCVQVRDAGLLPSESAIGLDPWGVAGLVDALLLEGFTIEQIAAVGQGFKLNGAIKGIERRLMDKTLLHAGQPMMTWCVGNAKAEARGNNVMITKERAGVSKIDPLIALFNATILMDMNPQSNFVDVGSFLANPVMVA